MKKNTEELIAIAIGAFDIFVLSNLALFILPNYFSNAEILSGCANVMGCAGVAGLVFGLSYLKEGKCPIIPGAMICGCIMACLAVAVSILITDPTLSF
jgi:hypothetical protein